MKRTIDLGMVAGVVLLLAGVVAAQSLGDVARRVRKENAKKTPAKVYTNDNLPTDAPVSVTGQPPADTKADSNANAASPDQSAANPNAGEQKSAAEKRDEDIKQWKQRFADQNQKITLLEREINVLQGEYRLRAAAYYADAGNALRNQADWAKQDRDYRAKLDAKQKQLDEAKQKLDDMKEDARKAGMPSSVAE